MTYLTKWAITLTIKRFIKKIITEFALLILSCFKSFLFMSRYHCQSQCWNNAQTPSMLFLGLAVLIFCQWMRKPCFFAFCKFCKLAYLMGGCVSLRGDIAHLVMVVHAVLCFCTFFTCIFSSLIMRYFLLFFLLWSIRQKKETLPKAKLPEGWVQLTKVTRLGHITSSNTNLDPILESRLDINFNISIKHQHLSKT